MNEGLRRYALITKSALFTIVIHGFLVAALVAGLWWPFSKETIERGTVQPIQAQAISAAEIKKVVDQQKQKQEQKIQEQKKLVEDLERLKKQKELEELKLQELKEKKKQEEIERQQIKEKREKEEQQQKELEKKLKLKEEKEKKEREKKKKAEEKRIKAEQEKKKKVEAEKKRKAEEKRKKAAEAKRKAEEELKKKLAAEQAAEQATKTKAKAEAALNALVDRIATAVEKNWRRPLNSASGLVVRIQVKVARNGEVLSASVIKSSGDQLFDESAEVAIRKASPLPFPSEPEYYEYISEFNFKFNPDDF